MRRGNFDPSAYRWGRKGFESGLPFEGCPYPTGCNAAASWRSGWRDAKADYDD